MLRKIKHGFSLATHTTEHKYAIPWPSGHTTIKAHSWDVTLETSASLYLAK